MSVLSHIFEAAGLATVGISIIRGQAETARPPRMLHCEFPLGRPLGKPGDAEFQTRVLTAMFDLLGRTDVPVLEDFPEVILEEGDQPAACPLPPRVDTDLHPAVDEAMGLRAAYDRNLAATTRTLVGRVGGADDIVGLIEQLVAIEDGGSLSAAGWDSMKAISVGQDIRAYYEEAGAQLAEAATGARQLEYWFYESTQAGQLLKRVRDQVKESGEDKFAAQYIVPMTQK